MRSIGVIGVGNMGLPMLQALLRTARERIAETGGP
jgi:3-hydroxyisobutyrate dehydrogenase-like beta-hydroxyacid dehydrogenase